VGALVRAIVVGTGGYLFGSALEILIDNIKHYELEVIVAIAITGGFIFTTEEGIEVLPLNIRRAYDKG